MPDVLHSSQPSSLVEARHQFDPFPFERALRRPGTGAVVDDESSNDHATSILPPLLTGAFR